MINTSFRASGFALAFVLVVGGCLHNADAPAPPTAVSVIIKADGSQTEPTTALKLTLNKNVAELTAADITLKDAGGTGVLLSKGALTPLEQAADGTIAVYTLALNGVSKSAENEVLVSVSKAGYSFSPEKVRVFCPPPIAVQFMSLTANGSETQPTTALKLQFSRAVPWLSTEDITLEDTDGTGVLLSKGVLTPLEQAADGTSFYMLALSGVSESAKNKVAVSVLKAGYTVAPGKQTVPVFCSPSPSLPPPSPASPVWVRFMPLTANEPEPTTALKLQFSRVVPGLSASNITLEDPARCGIRKGALSAPVVSEDGSSATYQLEVRDILWEGMWWQDGIFAKVRVAKTGYVFEPESQTVRVYTPITFRSLTVREGAQANGLVKLELEFSRVVQGLAPADFTLEDPDGTGIYIPYQQGDDTLENKGGGAYVLTVRGVVHSGRVTVKVAKAGYVFEPKSQTVELSITPEAVQVHDVRAVWETENDMALRIQIPATITLRQGDITFDDSADNTGIRLRSREGGDEDENALIWWSNTEHAFMLAVRGVTKSGTVSVTLKNPFYTFTPDTWKVKVSTPFFTEVAWSLEADGGERQTRALTLTFDQAVLSFSAENITLIDTGGTGIQKGALAADGANKYQLAVSGVRRNGLVTVKVTPPEPYAFTPSEQTVQVYGPP